MLQILFVETLLVTEQEAD